MTDAMKLDFKSIAAGSLQKEEEAVKRRFAAADQVLNNQPGAARREARKTKADAAQSKKKPRGKPGRKKSGEPIVRDIFSMPESDYKLLAKASRRCAQAGTVLYKSQIARLALVALDSLSDKQLMDTIKIFAQREMQRLQQ